MRWNGSPGKGPDAERNPGNTRANITIEPAHGHRDRKQADRGNHRKHAGKQGQTGAGSVLAAVCFTQSKNILMDGRI